MVLQPIKIEAAMNIPNELICASEVNAFMKREKQRNCDRCCCSEHESFLFKLVEPVPRLGKFLGLLAVMLVATGHLEAQIYTWNSTSSQAYNTAGNWSPSGGPTASRIAQFDNVTLTTSGGAMGIGSTSAASQAIVITSNYGGNLTFGASGTTGANLAFSLTGNAMVDGVSNVAISNNSSYNLIFNPTHTSGNNTLQLTFGNATNNVIRVANSGNVTINAAITGANPLTVSATGSGRVTLNGTNTYNGSTTVSAGTLLLGSAGSIATSSVLKIASGATFDVKAKSGGFTLNNPLTIDVDVANAGKLDATGVALTYGGNLTLNITTATPLSSYNLFVFSSELGTFSSIALTGSFSGNMTNSSGVWTASSNGYDFTFTESNGVFSAATAAIPEPGTWALMGIGTAFLLYRIRRKDSSSSGHN
jgi:fibronectin-binding autotransporter adhesin